MRVTAIGSVTNRPRGPRLPWKLAAFLSLLGAVALFKLALHPTMYGVSATTDPVDLSHVVSVAGFAPPRDAFVATYVIARPSPLWEVVLETLTDGELDGNEWWAPPVERERSRAIWLTENARSAEIVAERTAGYQVRTPGRSPVVLSFWPGDAPRGNLQQGDIVRAVANRRVRACPDHRVPIPRSASVVGVDVERAGRQVHLSVPTQGGISLELWCFDRLDAPRLPVTIHVAARDGSAPGGLMLALRIYRSLHADPVAPSRRIGGAGSLALDGAVGAVDGIRARVRAAEHAGAELFLVPRGNYAEVAGARKIKLVPVGTFAEAVAALERS